MSSDLDQLVSDVLEGIDESVNDLLVMFAEPVFAHNLKPAEVQAQLEALLNPAVSPLQKEIAQQNVDRQFSIAEVMSRRANGSGR